MAQTRYVGVLNRYQENTHCIFSDYLLAVQPYCNCYVPSVATLIVFPEGQGASTIGVPSVVERTQW